jgi:hypothetical protein
MGSLWTSSLIADVGQQPYWDSQQFISGTTKTYRPANEVGGSMQTLVFTRSVPVGLRDDVIEMSFHWAVEAGPGAPAVALSASQAASIEGIMGTWWGTMKAQSINTLNLKEYQWRDFRADFPRGTGNTLKYSPTWRTTAVGVLGTSIQTEMPHQIAETITQATASRVHWGRSYFPAYASGTLNVSGRWGTTFVDLLVNATRTAFNSAVALPAITNPWVWSARYGGLLSIRELHADDIPDVIRSRRDKQVGYRKSVTA